MRKREMVDIVIHVFRTTVQMSEAVGFVYPASFMSPRWCLKAMTRSANLNQASCPLCFVWKLREAQSVILCVSDARCTARRTLLFPFRAIDASYVYSTQAAHGCVIFENVNATRNVMVRTRARFFRCTPCKHRRRSPQN